LVDENGHPLANQRFLLLMEDGTQTGGVLDGDGKATVHIEGSAQIVFPGLPSAEAQ
jgi:hypothetical protein